ncbi:MAG TPA: ATP-binding protein [Pirellulales bacterium]
MIRIATDLRVPDSAEPEIVQYGHDLSTSPLPANNVSMNAKFVLRVTAPMIGVSLLLLTVGAVSAWYVHSMQQESSVSLARDMASMLAAEDLVITMRDARSKLNFFLRTGDRTYLAQIPVLRQSTDRLLSTAKESAAEDREKQLLKELDRGRLKFFDEVERAARAPAEEMSSRVESLLNGNALQEEMFEPALAYVSFHRKEVARRGEQSQAAADRMGLGFLLLGLCGSAAGLLAGFGIARGISRSIVQLSVPVHGAAGKLNEVVGPITLSTGGGFDELERALQNMADHIGTVVERLEQREREVMRSEQLAAVGQLAAGVAHELRNPLMAMKILVQAAAEREASGGLQGRDLAVVEEEIGRLEESIQSLLDFARPPQPAKRLVDLRELIEHTADLASARAEQQHVALHRDLPRQPAMVEVDGGQIKQVLLNLLFNALDALPSGGNIWIRVRDEPAAGSPGYTLRVIDDGAGLPAELGERIFEPFVSTKETGTGLGLPICRRVIEAHGGQIDADPLPERGAAFTLWLPRAESSDRTSDDGEPTASLAGAPTLGAATSLEGRERAYAAAARR